MRAPSTLLLALLALAGCATAATGGTGGPVVVPGAREITVSIDNRGWSPLNIYLVRSGGARFRLGFVEAGREKMLLVPRALQSGVHDLRLLADPTDGSPIFTSDEVNVFPGAEVRWQITTDARISAASITAAPARTPRPARQARG